jgi:hypothetical protein
LYKGADGFPGAGEKTLPFLFNWLFFSVGIQEIFTKVFYENTRAIDLYLRHGHVLMPEKDRVIRKYGREMSLATLSLSRRGWEREKYAECIAPFPTARWEHSPVRSGEEM